MSKDCVFGKNLVHECLLNVDLPLVSHLIEEVADAVKLTTAEATGASAGWGTFKRELVVSVE